MSINRRMDKQIVEYIPIMRQFSAKKNEKAKQNKTIDTHNIYACYRGHYAELKNPNTKEYTWCYSII